MKRKPVLLLLLAALLTTPAWADDTAATTTDVAGHAVDFTLPELRGGDISLSDYRGQWVVVNYWATWCAPCRKEIPDLSALHDERADVTVLGLAYEEVDREVFEEFLQEHPATYPILVVDVFEPPLALGSPRVLPTTFIVNPSGAITKTFYGPITSEDISTYIAAQG